MITREIKAGIFSVGALDWDRRLFDELIPLPEGTSYNAYLIKGSEKTALVDTVVSDKASEFLDNLNKSGVRKLDYIVSSHSEQDHSGSIPRVLERYPEARVVTNAKCKELLIDVLPIPEERFIVVKDGDTLSLGDKTLEFMLTPWVHWPDTMVTYLREDRVAFTCDFLGSHLATSELFATDEARVLDGAKRYYAEIMMPFRSHILKYLDRLDRMDLSLIAPSHGPVYPRPAFILGAYRGWASPAVKREVVIPYTSMYQSTATMVASLTDKLIERGLSVKPHNVVGGDVGEFAKSVVDASTIVFASPTVLGGPHPSLVPVAYLANILRPKLRAAGVIGSFGWGGKAPDYIKSMLPNLKVEFLEPVLVKGLPRQKDLELLERMAEKISELNAGWIDR